MRKTIWFLIILTVISSTNPQRLIGQQTTASQPQQYQDIPLNIDTPIKSIPKRDVDGKWYLAYHLFLTNFGFSDLTHKSVEVSDASPKVRTA